jgi:hypothetical protein
MKCEGCGYEYEGDDRYGCPNCEGGWPEIGDEVLMPLSVWKEAWAVEGCSGPMVAYGEITLAESVQELVRVANKAAELLAENSEIRLELIGAAGLVEDRIGEVEKEATHE